MFSKRWPDQESDYSGERASRDEDKEQVPSSLKSRFNKLVSHSVYRRDRKMRLMMFVRCKSLKHVDVKN